MPGRLDDQDGHREQVNCPQRGGDEQRNGEGCQDTTTGADVGADIGQQHGQQPAGDRTDGERQRLGHLPARQSWLQVHQGICGLDRIDVPRLERPGSERAARS